MKSYSQFSEDLIIKRYFPEGYIGKCIEIGAADGLMGSNTLLFEEEGWDTICVEPNPALAAECRKNRKRVWNCAIGKEMGYAELTIFHIPGANQSAVSSIKVDPRLLEQHKDVIKGSDTTRVKVETLNTIMNYAHWDSVDFVSIDTEGTELEVLKGFDIRRFRPKLFVIENNFNDPDIEDYLSKFNYRKIRRNAVNDFYEDLQHRAKARRFYTWLGSPEIRLRDHWRKGSNLHLK